MRVLVITQVFPSSVLPHSAPFNRQQLTALARRCDVRVWAPIPWLPGARLLGGRTAAGRLRSVPADRVGGLEVQHPRVAYLPGVPAAAGALYVASLLPHLRGVDRPDVILGAWAYPDGFSAVVLARRLGVPAVMKLHGSDVNVNARARGPRMQLQWALARAARVVAVSRPLADAAQVLGAPPERMRVVRNGVDLTRFFPRSRDAARATLGRDPGRRLVLFVGRLEPPKGVGELLDAFAAAAARDARLDLVLVGEGSLRERAAALGARLGPGRVHLAGTEPHERVPVWMSAADVVTLPSWNEGTPNVVLEALACGRPVVATRVGGIPDVLTNPRLGELVPARDAGALAEALLRVVAAPADAVEIVRIAAPIDWETSAAGLHAALAEAVG